MNRFQCEMFGYFTYDDSLSYHELLDAENVFVGQMETLLAHWGAEHLDHTPMGDGLMMQCAFEQYTPEYFPSLCKELHECIPPSMEGRLLFIDKRLASLHVYHVNHLTWLNDIQPIPNLQEALARQTNPGNAKNRRTGKRGSSSA